MLPTINPTHTKARKKLENYYSTHSLSNNNKAIIRIVESGLTYDLSKCLVSSEAFYMLTELADECELSQAIDEFFGGKAINETEKRAVLHTALRQFSSNDYLSDDIYQKVTNERSRIKNFVNEILS